MNKSPEAKAAEAEQKAEKKAARQKAEHEPDQDVTEKAPVKKKKVKRKVIWILVGIVSVILLLFGGYAYKVMVYDPANTISAQQQEDFNKLRDYAEGFDKALEEEQLELLDLQDKYNTLREKQKEELD